MELRNKLGSTIPGNPSNWLVVFNNKQISDLAGTTTVSFTRTMHGAGGVVVENSALFSLNDIVLVAKSITIPQADKMSVPNKQSK